MRIKLSGITNHTYIKKLAICLATTAHETTSIVCFAVGDTCVFVVNEKDFIAFPISHVADFSKNPHLLGSYPKYNIQIKQYIQTRTIDIDEGDLIIMATDAFSKWFLEEFQEGKKPWTRFENLDQSGFNELIEVLRTSKQMRDDDTTAIFIAVRRYLRA